MDQVLSSTGMTDDETLEQSFNIAWRVLRQSGDMGDENEAAGFRPTG